tara:strand:- start:26 stop:940 length:915 start_codon:yes stop_codon:yes gene_type:complete
MATNTNWNPYIKAEQNLCSYYYNNARKKYGAIANDVSIYMSTIKQYNIDESEEFNFSNEYMSAINKLAELVIPQINAGGFNGYTKFTVPHEHRYRNPPVENEINNILNIILPMVERRFYQTNIAVTYSQMYTSIVRDEPEPNNGSTWQWHVDCYPEEVNKLMIYLTDVTDKDAPFTYLVDADDQPVLLKSPAKYIDPKKELRQSFQELNPQVPNDRIPFEWVNKKKTEGYKEKTWIAKKGSFAIFRPNVAHKATVSTGKERTVASFTLRPSMNKRRSYWFDSPAIKGVNHHDWYGDEKIDTSTW